MANLNKVYLAGNLTKDPKILEVPNSGSMAIFRLAVNRFFKKSDGEFVKDTAFVDCIAFGRIAGTVDEFCKKGTGVLIEGELRNYKESININVIKLGFTTIPRSSNNKDREDYNTDSETEDTSNNNESMLNDEDIPF